MSDETFSALDTNAKIPTVEQVEKLKMDARVTAERNLKRRLEQIDRMVRGAKLLEAYGVILDLDTWAMSCGGKQMDIEVRQLSRIRRALGRLEMGGKDLHNEGVDGEIEVTMKAKAYPEFSFKYVSKVKAGSRCKIVTEGTEEIPAGTRTYLACDV